MNLNQYPSTAAAGDHMDARAGELSATTAMQDPTLANSNKDALSSPLPDALSIPIPDTHPTPEAAAAAAEVEMDINLIISSNDLSDSDTPIVSVPALDGIIAVPGVLSRASEEHRIAANIHLQPSGTVIGSHMVPVLARSSSRGLLLPGNGGHDFYGYNTASADAQDSLSSLDLCHRTSEYSDDSSDT